MISTRRISPLQRWQTRTSCENTRLGCGRRQGIEVGELGHAPLALCRFDPSDVCPWLPVNLTVSLYFVSAAAREAIPAVVRYGPVVKAGAPQLSMTHAEYCALEREAAVKHEFISGEVFAMTGGTLEHSRLAMRLGYLLTAALDGGRCRVLSADARVRIEAVDIDTYPDLSVVCGPPETAPADDHALLNPTLVVEVLSKSTEAYDRGLKASYYRQIPSLRAYLLVAQDRQQLELLVRQSDDRWLLVEVGSGQRLAIEPLDIELEVDAIYRDAFEG